MIIIVDGGLGAGKTYSAVALACEAMAQGRPVYANFHIGGAVYVDSWAGFMRVRDGVLVWDEAHLDIDSREFASNVAITPWLTQLRKLGVDLIVVSQNIDQVDKRLRRLGDRLLRCEAVVSAGGRSTRVYVVDLFASTVLRTVVVKHDQRVYARFNSRELVKPLSGRPLPLGALDSLSG